MKFSVFFLLFNALCASLQAQSTEAAESNELIDLGRLYEGQSIIFGININNNQDKTLKLFDKKFSCGCLRLVENEDTLSVLSNQSASFNFSFDSKGFSGETVKLISFKTTHPESPFMTFKIKCNVIREIEIEPPYLMFNDENTESYSDSLLIINKTGRTVTIDTTLTNFGYMQSLFSENELTPNGSLKMNFNIVNPEFEISNKKIILLLDGLHYNVKEIPIYIK